MRCFCIFSFVLIVCVSCSSPKPVDEVDQAARADSVVYEHFELGKVIPEVKCKRDTNLTFALYFPKSCHADKKNPIIFFFDPHASGVLPLEKYKKLAEKYGYVLVGSNNSKNGMSWEQNGPRIKVLMDDVKGRMPVNASEIYTSGFSGGSRVATSVAIFQGGVKGVIGMGAGFPTISEPIRNKFDYLAMAGDADFNMNELVTLNTSLDKSPIRHQLIIFDGKHEWAPAEVMEDAFIWVEVTGNMHSGNYKNVQEYLSNKKKELDSLNAKKMVYQEYQLCNKLINYFKGLEDVDPWVVRRSKLEKDPELKKALIRKEQLSQKEMTQQREYSNDMALKDLGFWTVEVKRLKGSGKNHSEEGLMNKRLLSYLSMLAYMNSKASLDSKMWTQAEHFIKVYQMVDPENAEHAYMYADVYASNNNSSDALKFLRRAVALGFKDLSRMQNDSMLTALHGNPEFDQILGQLASGK